MVTLSAATSFETALATPVRAVRAAMDRVMNGCGVVTIAEVMFTMRPKRRSRIPGTTIAIRPTAEWKFVSNASCHCSGVLAVKAVGGGPAQLVTRMSGASQAATSSARPRAVDTSATTARTSTPVARSADAASSQSAGVRELMTRLTPSRASDSAQARPRPFVDPATMAHRPAIPRST